MSSLSFINNNAADILVLILKKIKRILGFITLICLCICNLIGCGKQEIKTEYIIKNTYSNIQKITSADIDTNYEIDLLNTTEKKNITYTGKQNVLLNKNVLYTDGTVTVNNNQNENTYINKMYIERGPWEYINYEYDAEKEQWVYDKKEYQPIGLPEIKNILLKCLDTSYLNYNGDAENINGTDCYKLSFNIRGSDFKDILVGNLTNYKDIESTLDSMNFSDMNFTGCFYVKQKDFSLTKISLDITDNLKTFLNYLQNNNTYANNAKNFTATSGSIDFLVNSINDTNSMTISIPANMKTDSISKTNNDFYFMKDMNELLSY